VDDNLFVHNEPGNTQFFYIDFITHFHYDGAAVLVYLGITGLPFYFESCNFAFDVRVRNVILYASTQSKDRQKQE